MTEAESQCAANTDPVSARCSWCGSFLRPVRGGYWWECRTWGHPSDHHPARRGLKWRLIGYAARLPRIPRAHDRW